MGGVIVNNMTRSLAVALACCTLAAVDTRADEPYAPPPPETVINYFAQPLPCKIDRDGLLTVKCENQLLENKTLRELSIMRNTIFARYGWDGYRKKWLHDYFHAQPWFKPNPKFTYKLLNDVDRKNAHFIGAREQSLTGRDLITLRNDLLARYGKIFPMPDWHLKNGKTVHSCTKPKDATEEWGVDDMDDEDIQYPQCHYLEVKWYKPNPKFDESMISADDKIELGLLARAMGEFALDNDARGKSESSLDRQLTLAEMRQLSLRDLRLLRNTIYAKRGRTFKSEILRDHFKGMDWYKPRDDYSDKLLTRVDQRNIASIRTVENELGGPLSDEDWLTEPNSDGA
jgi:hypothetical protein